MCVFSIISFYCYRHHSNEDNILKDNVLYMSFRRPFGSYLFSREVEGIDRILWTTTLTDSSATGDQALVSIACQ